MRSRVAAVVAAVVARHRRRLLRPTCTTASISTGIPNGSAATPTADRAPRPASPRTSTSSSEQPSITAGCSVNVRRAPHEPEELHHPLDPVEIADLGAQRGQQPQAGEPGGVARVGGEHVAGAGPDPAGDDRPVGTDRPAPDRNTRLPVRTAGRRARTAAAASGRSGRARCAPPTTGPASAHGARSSPSPTASISVIGPPPGRSRPPCRRTTATRPRLRRRRRRRDRPAR